MATTTHGLPYPVGTDRVMDGDDAIKALAEKVDQTIWGTRIQTGTFSVAGVAASGSTTVAVTFPVAFTGVPVPHLIAGSGRLTPWLAAVSATAVTFGFDNWTPAASGSNTARWNAIGP